MRPSTPPSAITGKSAERANAANRSGPMARPAEGLCEGKTTETSTASSPSHAARAPAGWPWAAAVISHRG